MTKIWHISDPPQDESPTILPHSGLFRLPEVITFLGVSVLVLGALAIISFYLQRSQLQDAFTSRADQVLSKAVSEIDRAYVAAEALRALSQSDTDIRGAEMTSFMRNLRTMHDELALMFYAPRVAHEDRRLFEQRGRLDGYIDFFVRDFDAYTKSNFKITAPNSETYFPVEILEPFEPKTVSLLGVDIRSAPKLRQAIEKAVTSGAAILLLDQDLLAKELLLILHPSYRGKVLPETSTARHDHVNGVFITALDTEKNLTAILKKDHASSLRLSIYTNGVRQSGRTVRTGRNKLRVPSWLPALEFSKTLMRDEPTVRLAFEYEERLSSAALLQPRFFLLPIMGFLLLVIWGTFLRHRRILKRQEIYATTMLRVARDQAEAANRAKSTFLANMSHELRTPLNAIIGYSEILKGGKKQPEMLRRNFQEYSELIFSSGHHLLSIINDLLDLARIEAGELELYEEILDLRVELQFCVSAIQGLACQNGSKIDLRPLPHLPGLRADRRMFRQIIINLLSNALKYAPGKITLDAECNPGNGIALSILDQGPGLTEQQVVEIIEPFSRTERAYTSAIEGTGLGLPMVKLCMQQHQGTLHIESRLGVGTRARVVFPEARLERTIPTDDMSAVAAE